MFLRVFGSAVAIAALVGAMVSGQTPTVDDIVAKNLMAKGGIEKLRAVTSVKMTGRIKGPVGEMPVVSYAKRPNMMRRENVSDGQTFILAFDGKTVWAVNPLMSSRPREITGPQAEMTRQDAGDFDSVLLDYKVKGRDIELVGTEAVQGITMHRLRVTTKTGAIQEVFINAETMLESKMVMQIEQAGRKGVVSSEFSNYKEVDGIKVPLHIRQTLNGQLMAEVFYDQVQFNTPIDDALFAMPK